jgi:hypothetical protein
MKDQPQVNAVFKHGKRQLVARDEPWSFGTQRQVGGIGFMICG